MHLNCHGELDSLIATVAHWPILREYARSAWTWCILRCKTALRA